MTRTIVGRFDSEKQAREAVGALTGAGIDPRAVHVVDAGTARAQRESWRQEDRESSGGFWSWLFGDVEEDRGRGFPEADTHAYDTDLEEGAALVVVTPGEGQQEAATSLLEQVGADVEEAPTPPSSGEGGPSLSAGADAARPTTTPATPGPGGGSEQVIPVVEEQLTVGKRPVERGRVRVYTHVTEQPVEEHIKLRERRIIVQRRPADRPVDTPPGELQERTIELAETLEEPVVEKRARVVGEVVISSDVREREETVRDTVRRSDVEVQREPFESAESGFRDHCASVRTTGGLTYEEAAPAYRYGYELGDRDGDTWTSVETEARRRWEQGRPGTWDRFKDSIRYGWERARGTGQTA